MTELRTELQELARAIAASNVRAAEQEAASEGCQRHSSRLPQR